MIQVNDPVGKKQLSELQTVKPRQISIKLSDADIERLKVFCDHADITLCELVTAFLGDMIGGTRSNGGDERLTALSWYELVYLSGKTDKTDIERRITEELRKI